MFIGEDLVCLVLRWERLRSLELSTHGKAVGMMLLLLAGQVMSYNYRYRAYAIRQVCEGRCVNRWLTTKTRNINTMRN